MSARLPAARRFPLHRAAPVVSPRRLAVALLLAACLLNLLATGAAAQRDDGAKVDIVEVSGLLDRTLAGYLGDAIAGAAERGSEVVVVQLDTPGGLGVDGLALAEQIAASEVPVVVWVGPAGARAVGAGALLAASAHVLALSPGSVYGAAVPADLRAAAAPGDDVAASLEALAAERGRDPQLAAAMVSSRRVVVTAAETLDAEVAERIRSGEALPAGTDSDDVALLDDAEVVDGGVADLVAASLPAVLDALDGREVTIAGGATRALDVDSTSASVRFDNLGLVGRILHTIANPTLAYLLFVAGALTLVFEVFQPGFGVAGVCGLVLLGLGLYGLVVLPVSWLAFAGLLLGLVLLSLDLAVAGLGPVTAAGAIAVAAGSWFLFDGPAALRISPWLVVGVTVLCVVYFVVIMTAVLRAQGNQALAGAEQVIGKVGVVRSVLNPQGHVFVGGALWRARAPEDAGKVRTGTKVRVVGMEDGLTLDVELVEDPAAAAR